MSITSTGLSKHTVPLAYRVNDAVIVSGICRAQLYNLMRAGTLPFVEVGKFRLIRASDLRKLLKIEEPSN